MSELPREIREAEDDFIDAVSRQVAACLVHLLEEDPWLRRKYLEGDARLLVDRHGVSVLAETGDELIVPAEWTGDA